jgi:hypothetical protein
MPKTASAVALVNHANRWPGFVNSAPSPRAISPLRFVVLGRCARILGLRAGSLSADRWRVFDRRERQGSQPGCPTGRVALA